MSLLDNIVDITESTLLIRQKRQGEHGEYEIITVPALGDFDPRDYEGRLVKYKNMIGVVRRSPRTPNKYILTDYGDVL